ncbi:MAG: hypothetical protein ABIT76_11085 [Chthoniobacterales bacterium]
MQLGHDDFHSFLMRKPDVAFIWPTKIMDDVPTLRIIPPADVFDFESDLFQSQLRLFDLGLKPTMRQEKWRVMVE